MGEIMNNCWFFMEKSGVCKSVWAVCVNCSGLGLERDDYWVKIVPTHYSFDDFIKLLKKGEIIIRCKQDKHDIVIERLWFARKKMKEPQEQWTP